MSLTVQSGIPSVFVAGDAISFKITDSDHPAGVWTSQIIFRSDPNAPPKTFDGISSGIDHLFSLTNAQTSTLVPGQTSICILFSDGTNRQSADWIEVTVLPNPAIAEGKSFAQQQVDLLRSVIARFNSTTLSEVNFNNQNFRRALISDYQRQLTYYEARVIRERRQADVARGSAQPRVVAPRFVNDSESAPFPASTIVL